MHLESQGASCHIGKEVVFVEIERGTNSDISTLKQLHGRGSALPKLPTQSRVMIIKSDRTYGLSSLDEGGISVPQKITIPILQC